MNKVESNIFKRMSEQLQAFINKAEKDGIDMSKTQAMLDECHKKMNTKNTFH